MGVSPFPSSRGKLFKLMARDVLGRLQHQKINQNHPKSLRSNNSQRKEEK
jgi:hypothetical protein